MSRETKFGLKPLTSGGSEMDCEYSINSVRKCYAVIKNGDDYFIDLFFNARTLCDDCGKCLRYARKKANQRGEPVESAEIYFT